MADGIQLTPGFATKLTKITKGSERFFKKAFVCFVRFVVK